MANETTITIVGNLVSEPEIRYTPSGAAVANFTVASTPRKFNKNTNEWEDQDALFMRCSVWRDQAENVVESLVKGTRVIVVGSLVQRSYETNEGEKRTVVEMQVDEVGPSLKWATAQPRRADTGQRTRRTVEQAQAPAAGGGGQPGAYPDEPPFGP